MSKLSVPQKILLITLYALIVLMIFFSFNATKNLGQSGFEQCIQSKCEEKGQQFCEKFREIRNCCLGAGGLLATSGCTFM